MISSVSFHELADMELNETAQITNRRLPASAWHFLERSNALSNRSETIPKLLHSY